jgi:hypothetical protein
LLFGITEFARAPIHHEYLSRGEACSRRFLTIWPEREEVLFGIVSTGLEADKLLDFVLLAALVRIFSKDRQQFFHCVCVQKDWAPF